MDTDEFRNVKIPERRFAAKLSARVAMPAASSELLISRNFDEPENYVARALLPASP
jgi:hypothetical protein